MNKKIALIRGDGNGPEIVEQAGRVVGRGAGEVGDRSR